MALDALRALLGAHAALDAMHACMVLFPEKWRAVCCTRMDGLADLYVSILAGHPLDAVETLECEEGTPALSNHTRMEESLIRRLFCYWMSAMSLVRAVACGMFTAELWYTVAILYAFESMALQYEYAQGTMVRRQARLAALISLALCGAIFWGAHSAPYGRPL